MYANIRIPFTASMTITRTSLLSIVIATCNSARTLPMVLTSIRKQTYPQNLIEILVVDGGSTDETISIAKKFRCKIIANPHVEPVSAKIVGYHNAKGDYIIYLDTDEVIENSNSIFLKYSVFKKNGAVKAVIGSGYTDPPHASFITSYINEFGDPFSFFVYRLSKNTLYYYSALKRMFPIRRESATTVLFDFSKKGKGMLLELGAANTMIDRNYIKRQFHHFTSEVFAHLFQRLISQSTLVAMVKNDPVIHFSTTDIKEYLNKINWRVKNNIYHVSAMGVSGFTGRERFQSRMMKIKKYLFIPYAYSIILPLLDALYLVLTRRNISYLFHVVFTIITASLILYHIFLRYIGRGQQMKNYDESRVIPSQ